MRAMNRNSDKNGEIPSAFLGALFHPRPLNGVACTDPWANFQCNSHFWKRGQDCLNFSESGKKRGGEGGRVNRRWGLRALLKSEAGLILGAKSQQIQNTPPRAELTRGGLLAI